MAKRQTKSFDQRIIWILKYVHGYVSYANDKAVFDSNEYWATAYETLMKQEDDCDGINGLIYVLARLAGNPAIQLYCCLGNTSAEYHFWDLYYKPAHNKYYAIDGTFYPSFTSIKYRPPFKLSDKRYKKIDFIFNEDVIYKAK